MIIRWDVQDALDVGGLDIGLWYKLVGEYDGLLRIFSNRS